MTQGNRSAALIPYWSARARSRGCAGRDDVRIHSEPHSRDNPRNAAMGRERIDKKGYALGVAQFTTNGGRPGLRHCRVRVHRDHDGVAADSHLRLRLRFVQCQQEQARHRRD
jgi:hypothetical protein